MRFKRLCFLLLVLFCSVLSVTAQSDDWFYGKKIKNITFEGLKTVDKLDVTGVVSSFIGKEFSDDLYAEILGKIYALDYFDTIDPEVQPADAAGNNLILNFIVVERPVITGLKFIGNTQINKTELKEAVSVKKDDVFVASKLQLDERKIRDLYLSKGFTNVRVSSSYEEKDNGIIVSFKISEGRPTIITSVQFQGSEIVAPKTLKSQLSLKEASTIFQKGAFQESLLENDRQKLITYYQDRGYIDADVVNILRDVTYNEAKNQDELKLTFILKVGSQYTYGGITFAGNTIFSSEKLADLIRIQEGAIFNRTKFEAGRAAIMDLYYENGYTSNYFDCQPVVDTEKRSVSFKMVIMENPRSHIESIIVRGNTKTKDYVILRELPFESGDIVSKKKIENGLRNLYNTQFFSALVPELTQGSEENLVDMVINVEEGQTTSIEFGVAFSGVTNPNEIPVSAYAKWTDSNLGGTGKSLSTSFSIANTQQELSLSYSDSWLFGLPISVSSSLSGKHTSATCLQEMYTPSGINSTSYYMDYTQWGLEYSYSMGKRWYPNFAILSLTGGFATDLSKDVYDSDLYTPADPVIKEAHDNLAFENHVWTSFSVDDRDLYYDPSKGWFLSEKLTWTGLVPEYEKQFFLRSDTKAEAYVTLCDIPVTESWNFKLVLAGYTGLSVLFPAGDGYISSSSKLYIDGMFNGRGWNTVYGIKGGAMWSSNIELRLPIAPGIFSFDLFADAVVLKDDYNTLFNDTAIEDFRFSCGPGIRFSIPQFPLRLLLANTFSVKDGKMDWSDYWKLTLSFNIANR